MNKSNDKSKEAEKRKRDGEINLQRLGLSLNSELLSVGIIFDNLLKSDININLLNGINHVFNNFAGVDINVFVHNLGECCIFLLSPILDLKYMFSWTYPLIVTSASTLQSALNSKSKNIYCCFLYNGIDDPRVRFCDKLDLVEIIKAIVGDLKIEKR